MKVSNILIFTAIIMSFYCSFINAQISIIANKDINVKSLDINSVKNLFTLQSNEVGSKKVKLFFLNDNSETDNKFVSMLGNSFLDLKKIWLKAKLTGNGNPPEMVLTPASIVEKVMNTPGAIGFVNSKFINNNVLELLRIN